VDKNDIREALEHDGHLFDSGIVRHSFTPYLRDYDVVVETPGRSQYLYRFSHCPFAQVTTRVGDKVWRQSWDDIFTDYSRWLKAGQPDGYVWGICESLAYPGAKYLQDSSVAQEWMSRLGKIMHEVLIETNGHDIRLVFHDLSVKELGEGDPEWVKRPPVT
jgi:hypothetical protein